MKKLPLILLLTIGIYSFNVLKSQEIKSLRSPDGKFFINLQLTKDGNLSYQLQAFGRIVINYSPLGFESAEHIIFPSKGWNLKDSQHHSVNSVWKPIWGKRALVPDQYNEIVFDLTGSDPLIFNHMRFLARAYNDGVAFRYEIPAEEPNDLTALAELTRYNFAGDYTAWFYNGENHNIGPEKLTESNGKRLPVMTIKADNQIFLAVHEADLETGEPLVLESEKGSTGFSVISAPGKLSAGYHSAWRVILCGKTPGTMVDSHMIELLNPPSKGDFTWVKPGVAVWDWRIDGAQTDGFTYSMSYPSWVRMDRVREMA